MKKNNSSSEPLIVVVDDHDDTDYGLDSAELLPTDTSEEVMTAELDPESVKSLQANAVDPQELAHGRNALSSGQSFAEVGMIDMSGFNALERLRAKRSKLLMFYLLGCFTLVSLVIVSYALSINRTVRVAPSKTFVAQANPADVNPDTLRTHAELLVARMNTWAITNMEYNAKVIAGFLAPSLRDKVKSDYAQLAENIRDSNLMRYGMPMGSVYQGSENDVHTLWVAYERIETTGRDLVETKINRRVNTLAILEFITATPTDENLRGIYLLRMQEYEEEEWKRLGGPDVWKKLKSASVKKIER